MITFPEMPAVKGRPVRRSGIKTCVLNKVKYPKTVHLPYSPNKNEDIYNVADNVLHFQCEKVVATVKMIGQNVLMTRDFLHFRDIDVEMSSELLLLKELHEHIKSFLPDNLRIYGQSTKVGFYVFAMIDNDNKFLSWEETVKICQSVGLKTVYSIYVGDFDKYKIQGLYQLYCDMSDDKNDGYVIRRFSDFSYDKFSLSVSKWVKYE